MNIEIDEKAFEVAQWEIHLRRYALANMLSEVQAAHQLGMCDARLLDIAEEIVKEVTDTLLRLRKLSTEEMKAARLNGWEL